MRKNKTAIVVTSEVTFYLTAFNEKMLEKQIDEISKNHLIIEIEYNI